MSQTEKEALNNALILNFAEKYNIPISELKSQIISITDSYHVTINDERFKGESLTTEYLFKKFVDGKKAVRMTDNTIQQYKIALNSLESYSNKRMSDIEPDDINNWLIEYGKTIKSTTLKSKYQFLQSIYNFLYDHGYLPDNPFLKTSTPKSEVIYKQPITATEMESVKYACENISNKLERLRDTAIVYTFCSTGCRVTELAHILIKDIDLNEGTIIVTKGKGGKQRPVVLSDECIYRINLYLKLRKNTSPDSPLFAHVKGEEKPLSKDGIEFIIEKIKNKANVKVLTPHVFRRRYATELRRRGVPLQAIAKSMGHSDLKQMNRYSLFDKKEVINLIKTAL